MSVVRQHVLGEVRGFVVRVEALEPMPRFEVRLSCISEEMPNMTPVQARALAALLQTAAGFIEKGRP